MTRHEDDDGAGIEHRDFSGTTWLLLLFVFALILLAAAQSAPPQCSKLPCDRGGVAQLVDDVCMCPLEPLHTP